MCCWDIFSTKFVQDRCTILRPTSSCIYVYHEHYFNNEIHENERLQESLSCLFRHVCSVYIWYLFYEILCFIICLLVFYMCYWSYRNILGVIKGDMDLVFYATWIWSSEAILEKDLPAQSECWSRWILLNDLWKMWYLWHLKCMVLLDV